MNLKINYKKYPLLICLVIVVCQFFLIQLFYNVRFNITDDVVMMFLSRGVVLTDTPTPLLHFPNIIYGQYLVFFSKLFSGINFYSINNFTLIIISLVSIYYNVLINTSFKILILFVLVAFPFTIHLVTVIQFTILSSVLFISGIIALISYYKSQKEGLLYYAIISILFSSLIRFEQITLIFVFIFPLLVLITNQIKEKRKKIILVLSSTLIICTSLFFYNKSYYKNVANYNFNDYNVKIASLFYDFNLLNKVDPETKKKTLEKLNISENDAKLYFSFYLTPLLINKAKNWDNKDITNLYSKITVQFFSLKQLKKEFCDFLSKYFFIVLLLFLTGIYYLNKNLKLFLYFSLIIFYSILISQSLNYFLKAMPFRTFMPILFSFLCLTFLYFTVYKNLQITRYIYISLIGILLFTNIKYIQNFDYLRKDIDKFDYNGLKKIYANLDISKTYVFHTNMPLFKNINVYDTFDWTKQNVIYRTSMTSQHPIVLNHFKKFKYEFDSEMLLNDNIRFLESKNLEKSLLPKIKTYYKEHYNIEMDIIQDKIINGKDCISYKYIYLNKKNKKHDKS